MNNKELINFVEWLPENSGLFEGMTIEETVYKINELSTSDEGKQTLEQLTKRYKGMELFKKGGTLDLINCLQKGGNIQKCGCGKKVKAEDGTQLPKYAKIVETRQPYSAERVLYYSDTNGDYGIKDGRIISIEEGIPIAIGHNKLVRNARQFGLNLPEINEFREPWYGQYREQPDGMDLNSISNIDQKKAAKETAEKINKIWNRI